MIEVFKKVKEKVVPGKIDDLKSSQFVWVDVVKPTSDDLKLVSEYASIPLRDLNECTDTGERPRVAEYDEYSVIIFSASTDGKFPRVTPVSIFISTAKKQNIITIRHKSMESFDLLRKRITENVSLLENHEIFVRNVLDHITSKYFTIFDQLDDEIDMVETSIFKRHAESHVQNLFKIKKTLIYFHKALTANREVVTAIEKQYLKHISKKELKEFRLMYNDIVQLIDTCDTQRDVTTGVIDIYLSSVSNQTNEVVKKLTVIASFVLVPTLISGIYGMNFRIMPEIPWAYGYPFALGLMVFSVIAMWLYFKKVNWL